MSEEERAALREKVVQLALDSQEKGSTTAWFEQVYSQAQGDFSQIPWAKLEPHPQLQDWLKGQQSDSLGKKALVIGCGLGDDAQILAEALWQVTAFDISPTAIAWCRGRFPDSPVDYQVADLLEIAPEGVRSFDLVMESRTIQSLPLEVRADVIKAIASLVAPKGTLLVICSIRSDDSIPDSPPWPLSEAELSQLTTLGLLEVARSPFVERGINQLCLEYQKQ